MRKFILIAAAMLCSVGLLIYIIVEQRDIVPVKLIEPENMATLKIDGVKEGLYPGRYIKVYVDEVIDGDTIDVTYHYKYYKVRLLCIDTPESVKKNVAIQPYAVEASRITKKLILHKDVRLFFEKGLKDKYGRLLAYIILQNGQNVNALLVRNGFARVEFVSPNTKNKKYFETLQKEAIEDKSGMWSLDIDKQPFIKNDDGDYIPRYWEK